MAAVAESPSMVKVLVVVVLFGAIVVALLGYGYSRWTTVTYELRSRLETTALPMKPARIDWRELKGLPTPVQRYFRAALYAGRPIVSAVSLEHSGTFNMSETGARWLHFISSQRVITHRAGFDWNARIEILPGVPIRVHDAYIAGQGRLFASLVGMMTMSEIQGTPAVAEGELLRFLAEAAWYPTALLPSQGVRWTAVDSSSADATLCDGDTSVKLRFRFNSEGLIAGIHADARGRGMKGTPVPTPWEGRWWNYEWRDSMRVPLEGEVAWILPGGPQPYWRGKVTGLKYEFAH
jgi:hypothetical protein